jgi:urea transporter
VVVSPAEATARLDASPHKPQPDERSEIVDLVPPLPENRSEPVLLVEEDRSSPVEYRRETVVIKSDSWFVSRWAALKPLLTEFFLSYATLLMSRSWVVGALVFTATAFYPHMMLWGMSGVILATSIARILRLTPELIRTGLYGYNALLVALGVGAMTPFSPLSVGLMAVGVFASTFLTSSLHGWLGLGYALPILTLPFLGAFYALLGAIPSLGLRFLPHAISTTYPFLPEMPQHYLQSLGGILFLPQVTVGALVLLALVVHSRIAVTLSCLGFLIVAALPLDPSLSVTVGANALLVAIGLGAVWFVPSKSSFALALGGVLLCVLVSLGTYPRLAAMGLPLVILPFNVVILVVLFSMRHRIDNHRPHAVDFVPGTPEQNLLFYQTRVSRFGGVRGVRFAAPFRGPWTCTQGVSGSHTHRGEWRYALDFEVLDADGNAYREEGRRLTDYGCYRLPVIAPATGTVVKVIDGIADNEPGHNNLKDNWGNVIIVAHGADIFSCVAHLANGSITVREGQIVQQGAVMGLCGSSGRSPVPHLHFQLQATAKVGAPTLSLALHDVIQTETKTISMHSAWVPQQGDVVRNVDADADKTKMLKFSYEKPLRFRITSDRGVLNETVIPRIDLTSSSMLCSEPSKATLFYEVRAGVFTVHDVVGAADSALHLMRLALSRLPLDTLGEIAWNDLLPLRPFVSWWLRPLYDMALPFLDKTALTMNYRAVGSGKIVNVEGSSKRLMRNGQPLVETRALLSDLAGLVHFEVRIAKQKFKVDVEILPETDSETNPETQEVGA